WREEQGKDGRPERSGRVTLLLGGRAPQGKLYVKAAEWPRVNVVADDLVRLANRPVADYRGRRRLEFTVDQLAKLEVQRPGSPKIVLEQKTDGWRMTAPVDAAIDVGQAR